eukprot:05152.XXX_191527_191700_1 [CDS] Oithona nana genome sequencing.
MTSSHSGNCSQKVSSDLPNVSANLSINDDKCLTRQNLCLSMYSFQIGETFRHAIIES